MISEKDPAKLETAYDRQFTLMEKEKQLTCRGTTIVVSSRAGSSKVPHPVGAGHSCPAALE